MPAHDLSLLIDAARKAGQVSTAFVGPTAQRWDKDEGAGPVTEADLAVNDMLQTTLRAAHPDYGWLSEETEDSQERLAQDTVFVVDPIDGTRSFIEGSKTWAHAIAVVHKGEVTAGVVYLPQRDLLYAAAKGEGATLNGEPIQVSGCAKLTGAQVLATKNNMEDQYWPNGVPQIERAHRPSLAYRMSAVAQGRFDAMLTFRRAWEWDIAAGALIIQEAGGVVSDQTGAPLIFNNATPLLNGVIAGGAAIHAQILETLKRDPNQ